MVSGTENFGPGSYDRLSRTHVFTLSGRFIIPFKQLTYVQSEGAKPELVGEITYNALVIKVFEN